MANNITANMFIDNNVKLKDRVLFKAARKSRANRFISVGNDLENTERVPSIRAKTSMANNTARLMSQETNRKS